MAQKPHTSKGVESRLRIPVTPDTPGGRVLAPLLFLIFLSACGDTGCHIEETTTRVTRNGETYLERCWREVCPGVTTQTLRCQRVG